jgi:peptidoglycan hydrolase-like protein with peptidoglycan-binding domain
MPPGSVRVELPGGAVITEPGLGLPVLRYGRGLKPAVPDKDVVLLQQKLGIAADGRFGNDTRTAVSNFQAKQVNAQRPGWSLADIDGVVGPQTWTALFAVRA